MLRIVLIYVFTLILFFDTQNARAQSVRTDIDSLLLLREDFITANLLIVSPGNDGYSWLGHCALRMECPTFGLDYCFTFDVNTSTATTDFLRFLTGKSSAGIIAKDTKNFLKGYQDEGRGVMQYTLNMTPREKLRMWQQLDEYVKDGFSTQFDFLNYNCSSMCFYTISNHLSDERLEVKKWPDVMMHGYVDLGLYATRNVPWIQFVLSAIIGTKVDEQILKEQCLAPEIMREVMANAVFVTADGTERPALLGAPRQLTSQTLILTSSWLTPLRLSILLLVMTAFFTLCQWLWGWRSVVKKIDVAFLVVQALLGVLLLYLVIICRLFGGHHWNWCLLIFSPLPLMVWLCSRRRVWYHYLTLFYGGILILMAIAAPLLTTQLIAPHRILAVAIAIRCLSCAILHILKDFNPIPHNLSLHK